MKIIKLILKSTGEEYYFGSYSAIYDTFTKADIGVQVNAIWNAVAASPDARFENKYCIITRHTLRRAVKRVKQG